MFPKFRFELKNFGPLEDGLRELVQDLSNLAPFFRDHFIPAYLQTMQLQFETEGGFVGGWEGLDPEYERWKEKNFPGRLILQRTRKLKNSFSVKGRSRYLDVRIGPRSARVGTLVPYAAWVNQLRPILVPPRSLNRRKYQLLLEKYVQSRVDKHLGKALSKAEKGTGGSFLGNIGR